MFWLFKFLKTKTVCHICDKSIYDFNSYTLHNLPLCKNHYKFLLQYEWQIEKTVDCTSESSEELVKLWDYHQELFNRQGIISYITHEYIEREGVIITKSHLWTIKKGA
jgi:F0F1-type ATP synthase gamma subunit